MAATAVHERTPVAFHYGQAVGSLQGMSAYSHSRTSPVVEFGVNQSTFSSDEGHTPPPSSSSGWKFNNTTTTSPRTRSDRPLGHSSRPSIKSLRQLFGHVANNNSNAKHNSSNNSNKGTVSTIRVQLGPSPDLGHAGDDDRFGTPSPVPPVSPRSKSSSAHSIKKKTSGLFRKRTSSAHTSPTIEQHHPHDFGSFLTGATAPTPRNDHTNATGGPKFKALIHRPSVDAAFGMNDPTLPVRRKSFSKPDADRLHSPLPPVPTEFGQEHLIDQSRSIARSVSADFARRPDSTDDRRSQSLNRRSKRVSAGVDSLPGAFDDATPSHNADQRRKHASLGAYAGTEGAAALRDDLAYRSLSISSSPVLDGSAGDTRRPSPTRTASSVSQKTTSQMIDNSADHARPSSHIKAHGSSALAQYLQNSVRPTSQVGEPRSLRPIVIPAANSNRMSAASPIPRHRRTASTGSEAARASLEMGQNSRSATPTTGYRARPLSVGTTGSRPESLVTGPDLENVATTAPLRLSGSSGTIAAAAATGLASVNAKPGSAPMTASSQNATPPMIGTPLSPDSVIDAYVFSPQNLPTSGRFSLVNSSNDEVVVQPRRRSLAGPAYPSTESTKDESSSATATSLPPRISRRRSSASIHISNPPSRKQSQSDLTMTRAANGGADSPFEVDSFYEMYEKDRRDRRRSLKRQGSSGSWRRSQDLGDQLEAMLARPEEAGQAAMDEWKRISIVGTPGLVGSGANVRAELDDAKIGPGQRDDREVDADADDEIVENEEGEETIKVSALSSPQQRTDSEPHSSPLASYYKDSPVQEDVKFHDDDDVEVLHDKAARLGVAEGGRSMTVDEMESEIARMEAELSLSGRRADLEAIRHESMRAHYSSEAVPSGSQASSVGLQRSSSTGSTLSLGTLTRKWSIVEMERAYERMRGMLGSTRSFCLSEMDVDSGAEDSYDVALREDKLLGASNVALADANDEEVMALPSNRFLTPKPLDASTFGPVETTVAVGQPQEELSPRQSPAEVVPPDQPIEGLATGELERIEPKFEELPVSTESPVTPVKADAAAEDREGPRAVSREPAIQTQPVVFAATERAISPTQADVEHEDHAPSDVPRKESLASSNDPSSATNTDHRASMRSSGDLSSDVTNPTEVSVPTALSLKQYGTEAPINEPETAKRETLETEDEAGTESHTPQLSPRSSMQQQQQQQHSLDRDQSDAALAKSPASVRASSRLSTNSLRSGAGRDLQRWLAGEPRREAEPNDKQFPASPTPSTRSRGEGVSSRTGIRPLITMSPDRESMSDARSDVGLRSPKRSHFSTALKDKRVTVSHAEGLSSTRLGAGTWFPETPARASVRRANLRHSLDPRDVFGAGSPARGMASALGDGRGGSASATGSVKASSEVGDLSSEATTMKPNNSSLNVAGIRNMDKLEIFFKFTAAKADLEKAELERDALFDALQESRSTLADVRSQRDSYELKLDEERKLYKHLTKYLGDDPDEQIEALREFISGRTSWEKQAKQAVSQLDRMKDEMDSLRRELAECRFREDELERELIVLGAQVASRSTSVAAGSTDSGATPILTGPNLRQTASPTAAAAAARLPFAKRAGRGVSDESDLVFDHAVASVKINEQGTPLLDQRMAFGAKRSIDSVASPLKSRGGTAQRALRSAQTGSRSILPIILPFNEQSQQPQLWRTGDVCDQRDSVVSRTDSTTTTEDGSIGEHLPPRQERDWHHVRHGSTASAMLKLDAADEQFLRDLSQDGRGGQLLFPANAAQLRLSVPNGVDEAAACHDAIARNSHDACQASTAKPGNVWSENRRPRVAIIGAGAGGSSAAYFVSFLSQHADNVNIETDVTVFDKNEFIGGRSFPIKPWLQDPYNFGYNDKHDQDDDDEPVECGASIFVKANKNMHKAAKEFNLTLKPHGGEDGGMAVWDGQHFVFQESGGRGWGYWDLAKMFWRYGRAPLRVKKVVDATVTNFVSLYSPAFAQRGPFDSVRDFANATDLLEAASTRADRYMSKYAPSSELFVNELVGAATAVNYAQPVRNISALGSLVSMAATDASAIKGGNRRVFEEFLTRSGARVKLGDAVNSITKLDAAKGKRPQYVVKTVGGGGGTFDAVIFAAPFHQAAVTMSNSKARSRIPYQPYIRLYVTFVITNASAPAPEYFGLKPGTRMPTSVFATYDTDSTQKPTFNSLNYLQQLSLKASEAFKHNFTGPLHVVKMFSMSPLVDDDDQRQRGQSSSHLLDNVFGKGNVVKTWSKLFLSYPRLGPKDSFAPVRPDTSFYYVNAFEHGLISTMETETVSGFNVASLLVNDFFAFKPNSSWAEWD
ncbi:hypothetical protein ACM66B_006229 [Microbotryomycetes sp. NB124-2]